VFWRNCGGCFFFIDSRCELFGVVIGTPHKRESRSEEDRILFEDSAIHVDEHLESRVVMGRRWIGAVAHLMHTGELILPKKHLLTGDVGVQQFDR